MLEWYIKFANLHYVLILFAILSSLAITVQAQVIVRPSICIKLPANELCTETITLTPSTNQAQGCIHLISSRQLNNKHLLQSLTQPLMCWTTNQASNEQSLELSISEEQNLVWVTVDSIQPIEFEILNLTSDRRIKRKRRHIWSFH